MQGNSRSRHCLRHDAAVESTLGKVASVKPELTIYLDSETIDTIINFIVSMVKPIKVNLHA